MAGLRVGGANVDIVCDLGGFGLVRILSPRFIDWKGRSCSMSGLSCCGGHVVIPSDWEGETSTNWMMRDWRGACSSAAGVGCVGASLVSDSDVESSISDGHTSTL